jgi:hypothetical protein
MRWEDRCRARRFRLRNLFFGAPLFARISTRVHRVTHGRRNSFTCGCYAKILVRVVPRDAVGSYLWDVRSAVYFATG